MRRIGILSVGADDASGRSLVEAFLSGLQQLGWTDGRNVRIDYRRGLGDVANKRVYATELVALAPDVVVVLGISAMAPMLQATRSIPIVFANVADPVGAGFVERTRPADLPVQTMYELTINLKAAKDLGLVVSPTLASADKVME